ncbi:uncharacterized protein LOC131631617 [Vicia villosa]|uniref:uncharacterized protein LOC131631617 n=1 Tax=Vicia villosa TaxID=3911 RepID=UPI00273C3CEB|nr:uncharacterized protein LOC131631617 [Vicia villosa]
MPDTVKQLPANVSWPQNPVFEQLHLAAAQRQQILDILQLFQPVAFERDSVLWTATPEDIFSFSSFFNMLTQSRVPFGPIHFSNSVFKLIWKGDIPNKVKVFVWRCYINRVPTIDLLISREVSIPIGERKCVFCTVCVESLNHTLLECSVASLIWREIGEWISYKMLEQDLF